MEPLTHDIELELASCLCDLVLTEGAQLGPVTNKTYVSILAPEFGNVATNVYRQPKFTWFYLDEHLVDKLCAAGFAPKPYKNTSAKLSDKGKFKLVKLQKSDVLVHRDLFQDVMRYSLKTRDQLSQRTKK